MVLKDKLRQELCRQYTLANQVSIQLSKLQVQKTRCSDIWYDTVVVQKEEEEQEKLTAPTARNMHVTAQSTHVGLQSTETTACHLPAQLMKLIKLTF